MSYLIRLFKHVVTSGAIASHVLGDGRRRGLGPPGLQPHLDFGYDRARLSDGSALGTRGIFIFLS